MLRTPPALLGIVILFANHDIPRDHLSFLSFENRQKDSPRFCLHFPLLTAQDNDRRPFGRIAFFTSRSRNKQKEEPPDISGSDHDLGRWFNPSMNDAPLADLLDITDGLPTVHAEIRLDLPQPSALNTYTELVTVWAVPFPR